jgi:hypothetical protein
MTTELLLQPPAIEDNLDFRTSFENRFRIDIQDIRPQCSQNKCHVSGCERRYDKKNGVKSGICLRTKNGQSDCDEW